jgi:hypothetical protein
MTLSPESNPQASASPAMGSTMRVEPTRSTTVIMVPDASSESPFFARADIVRSAFW